MLILTLATLSAVLQGGPTDHIASATGRSYSGRRGETTVQAPRLAAKPVIDGVLDEPMWREAAVLTDFSQYKPVDGVPAADSTQVLIWYSPTALFIGVRAYDASGAVQATLANRDQIFTDDNIQVFLSTFNDKRQASFFAVNPLGIQADGALNEGGGGKDAVDLSQDFVWQSKGRVTADGYEVELRIPFKSLRSQQAKTQTWGINVVRGVPRTAQQHSWMPLKIGASSLLSQSGRLEGLTDLETGHVLDILPTVTYSVDGARSARTGKWDYDANRAEFGGNVRYGLSRNLTLNATVNPDFSQVESDVSQFTLDPREAVFFPEKRPFFLDGIEQFDAPSNLIYTRRIVQPLVAAKLTGKVSGTQIGVLAAVDDTIASATGDHPLFGIVRASHDLGPGSRLGALWTEQHDGDNFNRVYGADGRVVLNKIHSFTFAGAMSRTERNGVSTSGPIWSAAYRLGKRSFRTAYTINAISPDFRSNAGFISRPGIVNANIAHAYVWLRPKKTLEVLTGQIVLFGQWRYDDFIHGGEIQNRLLHFDFTGHLRSGWDLNASVYDESFGYDPSIFTRYALQNPDGSIAPWVAPGRIPNRDYVAGFSSPNYKHLQVNGSLLWGHDENFPEWASGNIIVGTLGLTVRPTSQLRMNLSYNHQQVNRRTDGSRVLVQGVPRARIEYQLSRAFQVRVVSEYAFESRDALRDDSRTNLPIVIRQSNGQYAPAAGYSNGSLTSNLLFSYFPNPGTVMYVGYGTNSLRPNDDLRDKLGRQSDGFFVKLSYLFRPGGERPTG
ncbi:MAG: DUF5916 domain-containing protein [Gemmatimonadota bacterium]